MSAVGAICSALCKARDIRAEYANGSVSFAKLAAKHRISKRAIGRLINRETYQDV